MSNVHVHTAWAFLIGALVFGDTSWLIRIRPRFFIYNRSKRERFKIIKNTKYNRYGL